jgi:hypothetical protein
LEWDSVIRVVLSMPPHRDLALTKLSVPRPQASGFRRRWLAEPRGQRADWERVMPDGRSIHVREYRDFYLVHWDVASPSRSAVKHLVYDAPHWLVIAAAAGLTALGALMGPGAKVSALGSLMAFGRVLLSYRRPQAVEALVTPLMTTG